MQRPVALRFDGCCEGMIVGLRIVADELHLLLDLPFAAEATKR